MTKKPKPLHLSVLSLSVLMFTGAMGLMRVCTLIFALSSSLLWAAPHGISGSLAGRQLTEKSSVISWYCTPRAPYRLLYLAD